MPMLRLELTAIAVIAAVSLAGCVPRTTPGSELWPTRPIDTAVVAPPVEPFAEAGDAYLYEQTLGGMPTVFVGNSNGSRPITVVLAVEGATDRRFETILVPAGRALPLAFPSRRIVDVR